MRREGTHPARSIGLLSRLHDGELPEGERREFETHVAECPDCAATAREFEEVMALYRQSRAQEADPELAARIARRLDARLRWRPPVRYVRLEIDLLWASVVATCLVAALALYTFRFSRGRTPESSVSVVAETKTPLSTPAAAPPAETGSLREASPRRREAVTTPSDEARGFAREAPAGERRPAEQPPVVPESTPGRPAAAAAAPEPAGAPASPVPLAVSSRDDSASHSTTAPVLIHRVEPVLPEALRRGLRSEGPFSAEAVIDERGEVTSIRVSPSVPGLLERPIVAALREWRYKPAVRDGKPVAAYLNVVIYVNSR